MSQVSKPQERLAELVEWAAKSRGLRGLPDAELLEFGRLYRRAASELAHARSYGLNSAEVEYLNWLVGRAYALLYVTESQGLGGIGRFFTRELPQTLRRQGKLIALAAALFLVPAVLCALLTLLRPDVLDLLYPQLAGSIHDLAQRHAGNRNWMPAAFRPIASSLIMVNNIQVSFFAFAGGMLAGLGTIYILIENGIMLGVLGAGVSKTPAAIYFWAFVAPHGVLEIPAIIISAAAGLLLARAIVEPGRYSRVDALRLAGRQASVLMFGVICFLVIAGTIEGLFSPAVAPPQVKFLVASVLASAFWCYVLLAGREAPRTQPTEPKADREAAAGGRTFCRPLASNRKMA